MSSKLVLLLVFIASISIVRGQNVLINGDFDAGPNGMIGTVTGWDVSGNVATVTNQGFTTSPAAAALSIGGNTENDMLSQTFATTIGQTYTLDLDAGVYGEPTEGPLSLQVQVTGSTTLIDNTVAPPNNDNFGPAPFNHYSYMFTADSASTTLKFTDHGTGNDNADVMVDTVSVAAVPEPATWALLMIGALPFAFVRRRRRA